MDGWMGMWVGIGVWGVCHACMHAHAHTCMHACMLNMHVKHDKHGCLLVGGHLQFLYMYTCACMCVHACVCMYMHVGTLPMPPDAPRHPAPTCPSPELQGAQNTKIQ